jgi:hypothetical protein
MQRCDLIVGEGATELAIGRRILSRCGVQCADARYIDKGGTKRFWADAGRYAAAAEKGILVLGLADLESAPCAEWLLSRHLPSVRPPGFRLRVAVRMSESWLLADHTGVAHWLRISARLLPARPDEDPHAKRTLVNLARRSRVRALRDALIPPAGFSGTVGREYPPALREFIANHWEPERAAQNSPSLARALRAIRTH